MQQKPKKISDGIAVLTADPDKNSEHHGDVIHFICRRRHAQRSGAQRWGEAVAEIHYIHCRSITNAAEHIIVAQAIIPKVNPTENSDFAAERMPSGAEHRVGVRLLPKYIIYIAAALQMQRST